MQHEKFWVKASEDQNYCARGAALIKPAITISHYECDTQRPFSLGQVILNCTIFHSTHLRTHSELYNSTCKNDDTGKVDCIGMSLQETGPL